MARDREREAWAQIEQAGTQGDGTIYRLKGGRATSFWHDKARIDGIKLLRDLKRAEANMGRDTKRRGRPDPEAMSDEDMAAQTIRLADTDGSPPHVVVPTFVLEHAWLFEPDPDGRSCGAFSEDTNGIRIADAAGHSVLVMDNDLRELVRLCARRMTAAREAERKAAEKRVGELEAQLEAARQKAGRLR